MFVWQSGGGLYIDGTATLTDTNVNQNEAIDVRLLSEPSRAFFPIAPLERYVCARCWQYGGGLYIVGTAMLTNTNVYQNRARYVCSPIGNSLNFHPAPRWNVTCARDWQNGGGLYIRGTATLTNTNVYGNLADYVCSLSNCP